MMKYSLQHRPAVGLAPHRTVGPKNRRFDVPRAAIEQYDLLDEPESLEVLLSSFLAAVEEEKRATPGWPASLDATDHADVAAMVRFAVNFYYARAGYRFANPEVAKSFVGRAWYAPRGDFQETINLYAKVMPWLELRDGIAAK